MYPVAGLPDRAGCTGSIRPIERDAFTPSVTRAYATAGSHDEGDEPMAKNEYHDYLRQVPLFADLSAHELNELGQAATELDLPKGRVLMREGDRAHEMFVIVNGSVEVTKAGEHVADIGSGAFVGEMAMLTHSHRHATVTTSVDTTVLHIDGRALSTLLHDVPMIAVKMLPIVAARVAESSDHHSQ